MSDPIILTKPLQRFGLYGTLKGEYAYRVFFEASTLQEAEEMAETFVLTHDCLDADGHEEAYYYVEKEKAGAA